MATWLGRSWRNVCTIRGENWPIANCTTTIVMVSTSVARETIDTAMVSKIATAASGPPVNERGTASKSNHRSTAIVPIETTTPASTHITGLNHRLERTLADDAPLTPALYPTARAVTRGRRRRPQPSFGDNQVAIPCIEDANRGAGPPSCGVRR